MSMNVDSKQLEKFDLKFWRRVEVSIDKILEMTMPVLQFRFKHMLNNTPLVELEDLGDLLSIDLNEKIIERKKLIVLNRYLLM